MVKVQENDTGRQREVLRMTQLTSILPTEAQDLSTSITRTEEAWDALNETYRGKEVTEVKTMRKLLQMRLPQGQSYDIVEVLAASG